jgi:hypothetical protein
MLLPKQMTYGWNIKNKALSRMFSLASFAVGMVKRIGVIFPTY